jgi:hypothetical protein
MILTAGLSKLRLGLGLIVTSTFGPNDAKFTSVALSLSSSMLFLLGLEHGTYRACTCRSTHSCMVSPVMPVCVLQLRQVLNKQIDALTRAAMARSCMLPSCVLPLRHYASSRAGIHAVK